MNVNYAGEMKMNGLEIPDYSDDEFVYDPEWDKEEWDALLNSKNVEKITKTSVYFREDCSIARTPYVQRIMSHGLARRGSLCESCAKNVCARMALSPKECHDYIEVVRVAGEKK